MRLWKKLFSLLVLTGALCVGQAALAQSASLNLRAVVAEEHAVAVACDSGGRVTLEDGTPVTAALRLGHNEETILYILPDDGYKIKSVVWNGREITGEVDSSGRIRISCLWDASLDIVFEKITDIPATGESGSMAGIWCLSLAAAVLLFGSHWTLVKNRCCSNRFGLADVNRYEKLRF